MEEQELNKSNDLTIEERQNSIVESKTGENKKLKIISSFVKIISIVLICVEWAIALGYANIPKDTPEDTAYRRALPEQYKESDRYFFNEGMGAGCFKIFCLLIVNFVTILLVGRIAKNINSKNSNNKFLIAIQNWNKEHTNSIKKVFSVPLVIFEWILFIDIVEIPSTIAIWTIIANVVTILLVLLTLGSINKDVLKSWFHFGKK